MRWVVVAAVLLTAARPDRAADGDVGRARVTYDVGGLVALGGRANLLDDAVLVGLTAACDVSPGLAVVAAVSGTRTDAGGAREAERTLLQYDAGVQAQLPLHLRAETALVPFVGAGLGARTRDDTDLGRGVDTDLTGYVAVGARLEYRFVLIALTAKDLVSASGGPWITQPGRARHDLALLASLGARF